jgi:hypothetical protein|tara:strand:+ start:310 stop:423 length:114 start_codon:yes stop_codon:yes gene_type:complete
MRLLTREEKLAKMAKIMLEKSKPKKRGRPKKKPVEEE